MYEGCQLEVVTSDKGRPKEYCDNHLNIRKQEVALAYYYRNNKRILDTRKSKRLHKFYDTHIKDVRYI